MVFVAVAAVADYRFNVPIIRSLPGVNLAMCQRPVVVSGNAMSPTITNGDRITFNQCLDDEALQSIGVGAVILYEQPGSQRIARVVARESDDSGVGYTVRQDNRPESSQIRFDRIIGVLK